MTKKKSKQELLVITFFLSLLIISSAYATFTLTVHAAELTTQEKGLAILNDVVGFNMTAYAVISTSDTDAEFLGLPEKEVDFRLASNVGGLRARCLFVSNRLRQIYISDYGGVPSLNQPTTDSVDMAKSFLERYSDYAANPFYGELGSMLNTDDIGMNITKTMGNVELEVSVFNQAKVDFTWTYRSEQGAVAPSKNVVLSYDHGLLKSFLDNWQLYTIVGEPELSSEEAIAIALKASESFSYEVASDNGTAIVSNFEIVAIGETSLCYLNYMDESSARDSDPFTLYPSWYIPLGFDDLYPGGVTGLRLRIWADTGGISTMDPMVLGGYPLSGEKPGLKELKQEPTLTVTIPLAIAVLFGALGVIFSGRIARFSRLKSLKSPSSRICALLLCFLVSASMIIVAVPKVSADIPEAGGKSMIYASMYGQVNDEPEVAEDVCEDLDSRFYAAGYDVTNAFNTSTTKSNVLAWASSMEENHHRVAVFHFGHAGIDSYYDNNGVFIDDSEVEAETVMGKHFFVLLWACWLSDEPDAGMPAAWTQRDDMSDDGFNDPDDGLHSFIGFEGASPALSCQSFNESTVLAKDFIKKFYEFALDYDYSVNDALNSASQYLFSETFNNCPLYEEDGFFAYWPENEYFEEPPEQDEWYPGRMRVFGNGDIHLNQYEFTALAKDQYDNYFSDKDVYVDLPYNIADTDSDINVTEGYHSIFVNDFWEPDYTGYRYYYQYYTYGNTTYYPNPADFNFWQDRTVTAHFNKEYCPGDVDGDGSVSGDEDDYYDVLAASGSVRGDSNWNSAADVNSDGDVDIYDESYVCYYVDSTLWYILEYPDWE